MSRSSTHPLHGARFAITRSTRAARSASRLITELGGDPVVLPLTRTAAVDESPPGWPDIEQTLGALERYDWLIFTSANGVTHCLDRLAGSAAQAPLPARLRIACVGQATARALGARGHEAALIPESGGGRALAEALIHELGERARATRILFPRALHGRDDAIDALAAAGAQVTVLPVYRTVTPRLEDIADTQLAHDLDALRQGRIHAIAFFAPSQVHALFHLLGESARPALRACSIIAAIGDTTRAALTGRGVDVHVVPSRPSAEHLVRAVAHAWHARDPARGAQNHDPKEA